MISNSLYSLWAMPLGWLPTLLMAVAALGWLLGDSGRREGSDRLELMAACLFLNLAALACCCGLRDDSRAFFDWAAQALVAGALIAAMTLTRGLFERMPPSRLASTTSYLVAAALAVFFISPA